MALAVTLKELGRGNMIGVTVEGDVPTADIEKFLEDVHNLTPTVIVPVYCGTAAHLANGPPPAIRRVRVVIGHPMSPNTSFVEARREIGILAEWIRHADHGEAPPGTVMIPRGITAPPTMPAAGTSSVPGFKVGDRVRDQSGSLGTILEIDTKGNPRLGQVRVQFDDGRQQIVALENGALKKLEERKGER
jgi:hypothetical protein